MTLSEIMNYAVNMGTTVVLLIVFVYFSIQRARRDEERASAAQAEAHRKNEQLLESARAREDMLLSNGEKREAMLREEAQRREDMIRRESEKRESILMLNMDRQLESMNTIAKSLNKIESRLDRMESRIMKGGG